MNAFRILVADDHPIFRLGLSTLLGAHEGWQICGEVADGHEAVQRCRELKPDLLILDICMPRLNGVDAARQILKEDATQRILVVTDVNSEQVIRDCLDAGVRGWVFKSDAANDLMNAVEALERRKSSFSPRVSDLIMDGYLRQHRVGPTADISPRLSPREREVVQLLGEGNTTKDVARTLNVTVKTAETHRSNIMLKLKLHSIAELVLYAVRNEIVHVPPTAVLLRFPKPGTVERPLPRQGVN
jgi:DNA-binding NarL/FixJ family response regulator